VVFKQGNRTNFYYSIPDTNYQQFCTQKNTKTRSHLYVVTHFLLFIPMSICETKRVFKIRILIAFAQIRTLYKQISVLGSNFCVKILVYQLYVKASDAIRFFD
jgi:hypothetical protein